MAYTGPLDRVWFLTSLSKTGYIVLCVSPKQCVYFDTCPKQGPIMESVVLNGLS